jgi:hypothetical protein
MYIKEHFVALSASSGSFGIDKLHLFSDGYSISDTTNWNIKPNTKKAGEFYAKDTPLCMVKGEQIYGERMYVNKELYTAELKYGKLYVSFNPSKHFHNYKLTTDAEKIADVITTIQTDLQKTCKTDIDLFSAQIQRMDISAQADMNNTVPNYDNVIRSAKLLRRAPRTEYPNGFLMGNKQRQLCSYDKGLKLDIDSGIKTPNASNLLRLENRLLKSSAMKGHTPFRISADLLTDKAVNNMQWAYNKTLNDLLPINQTQMQLMELSTLTNMIRHVQRTYKRAEWLNKFLLYSTLSNGNEPPTAEQFEQALIPLITDGTFDRSTVHRNVKKYQIAIHDWHVVRAQMQKQADNDYQANYHEFIEKFINPYKVAI